MGRRLLMVGWDGAERGLVDHLLAAGDLPALAALRTRGAGGEVVALPGLGDDGSWCTFATGVEPGHHGRFHHHQLVPGTYYGDQVKRTQTRGAPFWDAIADAGQAVLVLDVPKAPLGTAVGVVAVGDWMPHGADGPEPVVHPEGAFGAADLPAAPPIDCERIRTRADERAEHLAVVDARLAVRGSFLRSTLATRPWDLCVAVVAETHCAGHHAWPAAAASTVEEVAGGPVGDSYRAADRLLGELLDIAGAETDVVVFSLVGMGPNRDAAAALDAVLERLEPRPADGGRRLLGRLAGRLPVPLRRAVTRRWPGVRGSGAALRLGGRTAFPVRHSAVSGAIRVNLCGRDPHGTVAPEHLDEVCSRLEAELRSIRDVDTGRPVVADVVRVADRYPGARANAFADLLAVWTMPMEVRRVCSPTLGVLDVPVVPDRPGNHRSGGWYVAAGVAGLDGRPVEITEFAVAARAAFAPEGAGR